MMTAIADAKIGRWMKKPIMATAPRRAAIECSNPRQCTGGSRLVEERPTAEIDWGHFDRMARSQVPWNASWPWAPGITICLPVRMRRGTAAQFVDREIVAGRGHKGRLLYRLLPLWP
jgi:hypothetical protein